MLLKQVVQIVVVKINYGKWAVLEQKKRRKMIDNALLPLIKNFNNILCNFL